MKREKAIISTVSNFISSYIAMFIGIATGIIVTRELGPELKGEYANLKLITSLYVPFLVFGYNGGILYYGIRKQIDLRKFFISGALLTLFLSLVMLPVLIPLIKIGIFGTVASASSPSNILLAMMAVPFILQNGYAERVLRSFHLFRAANIRIVVELLVILGYYLFLFLFSKIDLQQALIGLLLGQIVRFALNLFFIIKHIGISWTVSKENIFKPWNYGIKVWLNQIIAKSNDKFDQVILTFLLAADAFGIYTVGVGLSNLVTQIPASYVNVFFNQITEREPEEGIKLYIRAQRITFLITTVMAIVLALLAFPIIYIMYGEVFTPASMVVVFYTPGLIFQVAARLSIKFYAAQGKPLKNSLVYVSGLVASLPFYFLLIPRYGISGAAMASSIAYMAAFAFSFYQINKEYHVRLLDILIFRREDLTYLKQQLSKISMVRRFLNKK